MTKNIYLTIDDAPSPYMREKVEFLIKHNIPAVFYCRGESINPHREMVIEAIQQGFLIGNHSFTHPHFSRIPLEECFEEILKTEVLIEECYAQVGITRPVKVIRLPFADRGAGDYAQMPLKTQEQEKVTAIQYFLKAESFQSIHFKGIIDPHIDAFWTWDTQDYKTLCIEDEAYFKDALKTHWQTSQRETEVILLHDFKNNPRLFHITMAFLMEKQVKFLKAW